MFDYLIPLAKRVAQGNLPDAYDLYNKRDVNGILPTITATGFQCTGRAGCTMIFEETEMNDYWLSDAMKKYLVSKDDKYIVGKTVLNPHIAKSITTREGQTRADASTYVSPDCGENAEIIADSEGYPMTKDGNVGKRLRIRRLTEGECYRFMGFQKKDSDACKGIGQNKSTMYHQAGDSIATTCLVAIFGELLGEDYQKTIDEYVDGLHDETK